MKPSERELPDEVRRVLLQLASDVLGELPWAEVPRSLRRIRDFAPARRPSTAAGPLAVALASDPAFRQRVAERWSTDQPELAEAIRSGASPATADPALVLTGLYLIRPVGWQEAAARSEQILERRADQDLVQAREMAADMARSLAQEEVERIRAELARLHSQVGELEGELASARKETRRLKADNSRVRAQLRHAETQARTEKQQAAEILQRAEHMREEAAERVNAAQAKAEQRRRAAGLGRSLDEARARLLLDTIVQAASGLRRELALPPVEIHPADLIGIAALREQVHAAGTGEHPTGAPPAPERADGDPALLDRLLSVPQTHLIVDGYNVTKTGFASLTLAQQRQRLIDGLAAVAARTGREITCCFDGAEVESSSAVLVRGVRVLFSAAGTSADELIVRLVQAEPRGRPVVVVTTDAEVAAGSRERGARAVPSVALVRLLERY